MKKDIAESMNLDLTKVYKWNWERMRKLKNGESDNQNLARLRKR